MLKSLKTCRLNPAVLWQEFKESKKVEREQAEKNRTMKELKLPPKKTRTCIAHLDGTVDVIIGDHYRVTKWIGSGSFGDIYAGVHTENASDMVAIKVEHHTAPQKQLLFESRLYRILNPTGKVPGIPYARYYGTEGDFNVLVLDFLGPSLESLFQFCNRKFSLKTVLMLADQLLSRLEYFHSLSFVHRDVKPDNFLIGQGTRQGDVFIIDYGLAKKYRDSTNKHIPAVTGKPLIGTARYVSKNVHEGHEQSRRDDLIALGYTLIYLLKGSLPWQGVAGTNKRSRHSAIYNMKQQTDIRELCSDLPRGVMFADYMDYCENLRFDEAPNYQLLKSMIRNVAVEEGIQFDRVYDWHVKQKSDLDSIGMHRNPDDTDSLQKPLKGGDDDMALKKGKPAKFV